MRSSSDEQLTSQEPPTPALGSLIEGWRRALGAPYLALAVLLATILASLPPAVLLHRSIETDLGSSATADRVAGAWDARWAREFVTAHPTIGETFSHEIVGFGGTLAAISRVVDGRRPPAALTIAIGVYVLTWIFLSGGVIDRLARGRPVGPRAFLSTSSRFFGRLLRLNAAFGLLYLAIFLWLHPLVVDMLPMRLAGNTSIEARALAWQALGYAVLVTVLAAVTVFADLARVRLVVEDRRSVLGAVVAGWRFVVRRARRVLTLVLLNILVLAVLTRLWLQVAPGASGAIWIALAAGQVYLVARIASRLAFIASEVVFFQGELAYAGYTAPPAPRWPASVSVQGLRNLRAGRADRAQDGLR